METSNSPRSSSHRLYGHLSGTTPAPPEWIMREVKNATGQVLETIAEINPEYEMWMAHAQFVVAYITSTLSKEVLAGVDDDLSALALWNVLATTYSQISEARFLQLKRQFQDIKRDTRSILEYIHEIKNVNDQLAIIGHPVSNKDKVQHALSGLGSEFDVFCTALEDAQTNKTFAEGVRKGDMYVIDEAPKVSKPCVSDLSFPSHSEVNITERQVGRGLQLEGAQQPAASPSRLAVPSSALAFTHRSRRPATPVTPPLEEEAQGHTRIDDGAAVAEDIDHPEAPDAGRESGRDSGGSERDMGGCVFRFDFRNSASWEEEEEEERQEEEERKAEGVPGMKAGAGVQQDSGIWAKSIGKRRKKKKNKEKTKVEEVPGGWREGGSRSPASCEVRQQQREWGGAWGPAAREGAGGRQQASNGLRLCRAAEEREPLVDASMEEQRARD
ncbi:hypothetical protein EJ110_NYTH56614 [Nymphaea thermarum]|nr:hypothetical protein EJ110_NYTH56614 [Nymphaea thermarum]